MLLTIIVLCALFVLVLLRIVGSTIGKIIKVVVTVVCVYFIFTLVVKGVEGTIDIGTVLFKTTISDLKELNLFGIADFFDWAEDAWYKIKLTFGG